MENSAIGVFDSGFGGLTILKEIIKELPEYDYIYLGDTARAPYGNRSQEVVYGFTKQAVKFLFQQNCQLIIVACNTASSEALRRIQREYLPKYYSEKRVLGVIIPAVESATAATQNRRVGVMATEGTVGSGAFEKEFTKINPEIKVFQKPCPLLVSIVEAGEQDSDIARIAVRNYLKPLMEQDVDTLILGCTHYGLLEKHIKEITGKGINIISEGRVVAGKLKDYLERHPEIENMLAGNQKRRFLTTDLTDKFQILGSKFFGKTIKPQSIEIGSQ